MYNPKSFDIESVMSCIKISFESPEEALQFIGQHRVSRFFSRELNFSSTDYQELGKFFYYAHQRATSSLRRFFEILQDGKPLKVNEVEAQPQENKGLPNNYDYTDIMFLDTGELFKHRFLSKELSLSDKNLVEIGGMLCRLCSKREDNSLKILANFLISVTRS